VLDEASLLATAAYIDLNPAAAGVAPTPEASEHTSLRARIDHARAEGTLEADRDEAPTTAPDAAREASQEPDLWLLPTGDRRDRGEGRPGSWPAARCLATCGWSTAPAGWLERGRPTSTPTRSRFSSGCSSTPRYGRRPSPACSMRRGGPGVTSAAPRGWTRRRGVTVAAGTATCSAASPSRPTPRPEREFHIGRKPLWL
jgi:hypothetical protein